MKATWPLLLFFLLLLATPAAVEAQFTYTTNADGISLTITGYTGSGGAVNIPANINGLKVINIGTAAFIDVINLASVTIPASVTSIGDDAFQGCASLAGINLENGITSIGGSAFQGCASLASVTIPNTVTVIRASAFAGCSSLTSLTLPTNLTSIGDTAFAHCASLASVTIPASVTNIGGYAFELCANLARVIFDGNAPAPDSSVFRGDAEAIAYYYPGASGWGAMYYDGIPAVEIPEAQSGVLQVAISPAGAVAAGAQWQVDGGPLQNNNQAVLGLSPGCHTVSFSTVSGWTTPADQIIFISVRSTTMAIGAYVSEPFLFAISDGTITITGYTGPGGAVAIPTTINGLAVTAIGAQAFMGNASLTNVTIPGAVTCIGDDSFSSCANLAGIYFGGNAPMYQENSFYDDTDATVYYLPGTTGWTTTFAGLPTALWLLANPVILNSGSSFGPRSNEFGFVVSWATNLPVVVQACVNLANPVWVPLQTNTLINGSFLFADPQWANFPSRYYRVSAP